MPSCLQGKLAFRHPASHTGRDFMWIYFKEQAGGLKCFMLQPLAVSMCVYLCVITDEVRGYGLKADEMLSTD